MNTNDFRIMVAAQALREAADRIEQLERQKSTLLKIVHGRGDRINTLERENVKLRKKVTRYTDRLDKFHTGQMYPDRIATNMLHPLFNGSAAPSYNELARMHASQAETIRSYQAQVAGDAKTLPSVPLELFSKPRIGEGRSILGDLLKQKLNLSAEL